MSIAKELDVSSAAKHCQTSKPACHPGLVALARLLARDAARDFTLVEEAYEDAPITAGETQTDMEKIDETKH